MAEIKEEEVGISLKGKIELGIPNILIISKKNITKDGISMAADLLEAITGVRHSEPQASFIEEERISNFRDYLIELLEKKFGLRVKVCINCKYCDVIFPEKELRPLTTCGHPQSRRGECICTESNEHWAPEEIPEEKKEKEKSCGNCGDDDCVGLKKPCGNWIPK